MVALAGPYFILAALLVVSGLPKLSNPANTAQALSSIGLPQKPWLGRAVGGVEIAIGIGTLAIGGRLSAAAFTVLYAGFAGFIVFGLRSSRVKSCGCFGSQPTPPSALHLAVDLAAVAIGVAMVAKPVGDITAIMSLVPWAGVPLVLLVAIGTWLALLVLTLLPAVAAEAKA